MSTEYSHQCDEDRHEYCGGRLDPDSGFNPDVCECDCHRHGQLKLHGVAGSPIWAMRDGGECFPIGLRLDSGDSGVVYLSDSQAADLVEQLNKLLSSPAVIDANPTTEPSTARKD
jgi:hypothetical protein